MGNVKPGYVKVSLLVLDEQVKYLKKNHINKSALSRRLLDKYIRDGCKGNLFDTKKTSKFSVVIRQDQLDILQERLIDKSDLMQDLIFEWMKTQGL